MSPAPDARGADPSSARLASIPALTSLRFFAAFAVLALHYRDLLGPLPEGLRRALVGGQYGVTFFFVLSGFILTYNYHDWFRAGVQDGGYWRFQRLRFARIYPVYLFGLLLDTPWHLLERAQAGQLANSGHVYWASWLLNLFGLQAWVPGVPYAMFWNTPAWSVSAELFFYATFPVLCATLARRLVSLRALVIALVAVVVADTLLYAGVLHLMNLEPRVSAQTQYLVIVYNPLLRYGEFLAGCLAGLYFVRTHGRSVYLGARLFESTTGRNTVLGLMLLAVALRLSSPDYTGPSREAWLLDVSTKYSVFILPFVLMILAIARGPTLLTRLLEQPWLVLLGEASYALYIIHWAGQTVLQMRLLGSAGTPLVHLAVMLGTVAASLLCHRYIELPWRRRLRPAALPLSTGSATAMPA
jgi:peptidoglycan/LPS O-acetylase OafA/YrhL